MARIGLLSMSDGRDFVHRDITEFISAGAESLAAALRAAGHEVIVGDIVWTNAGATAAARRLADQRVDLTIFHYAVWAFPHFTMLAAEATPGPLLLFGGLDPVQPGMVGMLAAGGALDQIGRRHTRAWGDIDDPVTRERVLVRVRAAAAAQTLRGATFGRIGGRPMGMYTAVADTDQWMRTFGIDVEEIDQWEIVRRSESVDAGRVSQARMWLEKNAAGVHYDGKALTPELFERQIRSYYAVRELIDEWRLDFSGIKGQPELTTHFATMDIAEAFLNDPYDWEGPKPTHVTATESDMDAALTMQLLKGLSGTPVLFADVRHYHADRDVWDLCNSGQHATWFAARSDDPLENLARTHFYPEVFFFPAGGASVHHLAAPGSFTLARLTRLDGRYRLQAMRGEFENYDAATNDAMMRMSTFEWPHAFARLHVDATEFLNRFGANHIHAIPGEYVAELRALCELLDIDYDGFGDAA
ncbi:L-fucose/L-arabinose isomerase family protein [Nocardia sp. CDC159]|uniref:FucIase n=1 Tax=Nocardia pulmonis TaxID=2951408 RepID=A0A9X2E2N7_9NOCA|nr:MULTISPECIES: L-fucose/L-arabinose isomerase family protein [Nocardia]MCM6773012.1 L-fucose/L-arabinose isomerase family protein [Nocardia pulmonis]MCM6785685.1 L-fucose/L-arabinose isomerase family protein [Nocardia sp. CDC159]